MKVLKVTVLVGVALLFLTSGCIAPKGGGGAGRKSPSAEFTPGIGQKGNVLFTIGADRYTDEDLKVMFKAFNVPPEQMLSNQEQLKTFIDQLVDQMLLERQAGLEGMEQDPEVQMKLRLTHMRILADAYSKEFKVPDSEVQKYYDEHKSDYLEITLAMFSVKTEANGKKAAAEARKAADFDSVAIKYDDNVKKNGSTHPVKFSRSQQKLPEDLDKAIFSLKAGEVSEPVQISGPQGPSWLVIKELEQRQVPFEEAKEGILKTLRPKLIEENLKGMRDKLGVKVDNDAIAKMVIKPPEMQSTPLPPATSPPPAGGGTAPAPKPPAAKPSEPEKPSEPAKPDAPK